MMKNWHYPFLAFLIIGTVLILVRNRPEYHKNSGNVFGTSYNICYCSSRDMHGDIMEVLRRVDNALSMFNDSSTISRINRENRIHLADDTTFTKVFKRAMDISRITHGAFDITVAPAVNAWGFGFKQSEDVTDDVIDSLKQIVGYTKIHEVAGIVFKENPHMMLDCSAIAKGYGCDAVADMLRSNGIRDFMVEIGGEIVVSGVNPHGQPWNIGVSRPDESFSGSLQTVLQFTDCAMATSGNYRNFYVRDGVKYAHTIDPKTCRPVAHSLLSATVIAGDCATADAFATSFMVMGADSATAIVSRMPELKAYLVVASGDSTSVIDLTADR